MCLFGILMNGWNFKTLHPDPSAFSGLTSLGVAILVVTSGSCRAVLQSRLRKECALAILGKAVDFMLRNLRRNPSVRKMSRKIAGEKQGWQAFSDIEGLGRLL